MIILKATESELKVAVRWCGRWTADVRWNRQRRLLRLPCCSRNDKPEEKIHSKKAGMRRLSLKPLYTSLFLSLLYFYLAALAARTASAAGTAYGAVTSRRSFSPAFCRHFDFLIRYLAVSFCASVYGLNSCHLLSSPLVARHFIITYGMWYSSQIRVSKC